MKTNSLNNTSRAMTLMEVLLVLFVLSVLLILLLLSGRRPPVRASRINCVSNLKQIGLALRMFSGDHGEKFPWAVSITNGGTLEFAESPAVYRHFLAVSDELSSPKVLQCYSDAKTTKVSSWPEFDNRHLSYFVGLEANEANPQTILSGDRNIVGGQTLTNGVMRFDAQSQASWNEDMHKHVGNIGLGDGSALQVTDKSLRKQIQSALLSTNVAALRFSVPKPN